jgi:hypothetical protein
MVRTSHQRVAARMARHHGRADHDIAPSAGTVIVTLGGALSILTAGQVAVNCSRAVRGRHGQLDGRTVRS